ncbi:MAG TPA: 5-(carboxyamino)imidazole ribonucleotide synthase [Stellaceae bacterium]|jgi:5-(carboxyamino)imidazole ribonucleotide synthase|nr:5-(carboxyamino)imidazole ribonucleotide synthase [Stellaceae bacterium]
MLSPGATIGILGGGQLGRMTAMAAARLGYRAHIFATERDSPAEQVAAGATVGAWDDAEAIARFSEEIDVATFEFENIPAAAVRRVAALKPVMPRPEILEIAQDRMKEKDFLNRIGVATTGYCEITSAAALGEALGALTGRSVLKSARMGYDGKGQINVDARSAPDEAWRAMGAPRGVLEDFVDFRCEASVVVARGADGAMAAYPLVENRHVNHILDTTIAPATLPLDTAREAERIACDVAARLNLVGVLAVEMFVTRDDRVLVNELAPRPHNSGHWTIDACATSQFEQLVRAICGLPLGSTERHADAVMKNLIGDEIETWRDAIIDPTARLHLYGKRDTLPGRKMGHVTRLLPKS